MTTAPADQRWPGEHFGLPETGPRSIARLGRRVAAIFIDWGVATLLSLAFFPAGRWETNGLITLAIFAVEQIVFLVVVGGSLGHLILGMRVVPLVPGPLGFWRPIVRTLLLCLAVPPLIWDADQRGLHDRVAGTLLVRV